MPQALSRIGYSLAAVAAALLAALILAPGRAEAAVSSCSISSAGILFSPYNAQTQAAVDGAGTITVTCSGDGSSNSLSLNLSGGNAGSCTTRQMRRGLSNLNYQIYREASRTNSWCDGGSRLDFNVDFTTGSSQTLTFTMYGRVLASQNPTYSTSEFTDSLTVSIKRGGNTVAAGTASIRSMVAAICSVSAGTLGFGAYSGAIVNATATVSVNCTNSAPYSVALGGGSNQSGSTRRMAGPSSSFLSYQLFSDALRVVPWGDGSAQLGGRVGGTGSGTAQSLTVYGRIPASQNPAAGSYTDSVLVTVEY